MAADKNIPPPLEFRVYAHIFGCNLNKFHTSKFL